MVSILKNGLIKSKLEIVGLSTDTLPTTNISNGAKAYIMDSGKTLYFNEDAHGWLDKDATDNLTSIAITTNPSKTSYVEGQSFVATGMIVTATYGSGQGATTEVVTTSCVIDAPKPLKTTDTKVHVYFSDKGLKKSADVTITVVAKAISSISVKTAPTKTEYTPEDNILDMSGLVITATYNDESTKDVSHGTEGLTYSPENGSTVTESGNVTITYDAKTCTQAITYTEPEEDETD